MASDGCLGCQRCEDGPVVELADGRTVCTYCPDYLRECEARHLLAMPLPARQEALARRSNKRGGDAIAALKKSLTDVHAKAKAKGNGKRA